MIKRITKIAIHPISFSLKTCSCFVIFRISEKVWYKYTSFFLQQKRSRLFSRDRYIIRLQFPFVFRRFQSLQLLLSDSPLSLDYSSDLFWAENSAVLTPFPFRFLTPAVSAFFRPLQFWVLTTQPLFFLSFSSRFRLTVASPVPVSALASSVSPFSPA